MIQKEKCPICNSKKIEEFLQRKDIPVHQNFILRNKLDAININKDHLKMFICKSCGFIFNSAFDINKLQYGELYDNTQEISPIFSRYLDNLVEFIKSEFDIENKRVIEVGCGKGSFLKRLANNAEIYGVGFDPSYIGEEEILNGRIKFRKCYYDKSCADVPADIVICRHVIEHVPEPVEMLSNIRHALINSPNALVFFETPSIKWILENKVIYDLFYEHCSYFEDVSITKAFNTAGFNVEEIIHEFNGQYMWVIAKTANSTDSENNIDYGKIEELIGLTREYNESLNKIKGCWENKIRSLRKHGKIALWGAGAKGVTFANLLDITATKIDCVIDINKNKQGCYIPGTGHEIVDFAQITERNIKSIIVMNMNYLKEIQKMLHDKNIKVDLISGEEFE